MLEHEIKYLVPATNAAALVMWTSSICLRDGKYPPATVHTVYYDTPRLALLGEKIGSDFLKTKVRVRWYADRDGRPGDALFAEAKFRVGSQRRKVRHRLPIHAAEAAGRPLHVVTLLPLLRYGLELAVSSDQSGPQSWLGSDGPAAFTRYRIDGSTPGQAPEGSE